MRIVPSLSAVLAAAVLTIGAAVGATSASDDPLRLPAPSGEHPVGMTDLHLVDEGRPDPLLDGPDPAFGEVRFHQP